MKCKECEGKGGYQPLLGPYERCAQCAGTGNTVDDNAEWAMPLAVKTVQLVAVVQFKDAIPKVPKALCWSVASCEWLPIKPTHCGYPGWKELAAENGNLWWMPMPASPE